MYVRMYKIDRPTPTTLVKRPVREKGFDVYMPVVYTQSFIPYRQT